MKIGPARRIRGRLTLPGDKSISHRAAIFAALADGRSELINFATGADCASTLDCLGQLGATIKRVGASVRVTGTGGIFREPTMPLDCGNSGSTMRLLSGVLAGQNFSSELTGDDSLRSRPMKRIIEPLESMGARIDSAAGFAPLRIKGQRPLKAITYELPVSSAQVKSCVLLAGLAAEGRTSVIEQAGLTRDHTERMLHWFAAPFRARTEERQGGTTKSILELDGPTRLTARDVVVPGDISSAAFFIAAAALLSGSELELKGVGLNPTRSRILRALESLRLGLSLTNVGEQCGEPVGTVHVLGIERRWRSRDASEPFLLRGPMVAPLIDELPVLAVIGSQLKNGIEVRDAAELRVKESDRIRAVVRNLRAMGAKVEEYEDGFSVRGGAQLRGARIETYGDHRIAMAFTVAALLASEESELDDADCVGISFPEFFELLESVVER